jgi:hypothetical protein
MKTCEEQKEHHSYTIGTWNVRTLNQAGKLENLKTQMRRKHARQTVQVSVTQSLTNKALLVVI